MVNQISLSYAKLPRDKGGRHVPGYPKKVSGGSSTPEGYQKEKRAHKPSPAGTKGVVKKKSGMSY